MKEEIKVLLRRAEGFIDDAVNDLEKGRYDLAMVHIEQAMQLVIKAKLLEAKGVYEKTHNLKKLLEELAEVYKGEEIKKFLAENMEIVRLIGYAYIAGRYLVEEFEREEVEKALRVYEELRKIIWG